MKISRFSGFNNNIIHSSFKKKNEYYSLTQWRVSGLPLKAPINLIINN